MAIPTAPRIDVPLLLPREAPLEVRSADPQDRQEAWALQRSAFNLPDGPPPPHPGHSQELRVAVRGDRVVSCLTLIHADLCLWGASLPMGGVRHVATHPEEQNQGYASALMRDTLFGLRRQGVAASVLFPFSFRYYRKFGYELGGNHCHFWCRPNCLPAYQERHDCRPLAPQDCEALARFYTARGGNAACRMARDERRWQAICSDDGLQTVVYAAPEIEGYAVLTEDRDSYGGRVLKVLDLAATTGRAWRGLEGYLSEAPVESVEWYAGSDLLAESGLLRSAAPLREGFKPRAIVTVRPMFQFRVVDLPGALRARLPVFPTEPFRLALRIKDDLLTENNTPVAVQGPGSHAEVRAARPTDPYLETDIRIFSQIFCGYLSVADAVSQDLARCSSQAAFDAAEALFPSGEPFIAELDRF